MGLGGGLLETYPSKNLAAILCYILNLGYTRAFTPFLNPYIIRLLRWTLWQLLLRAAYNKKNLSRGGKPFYVCQDLPVEIQQRRAEYGHIEKKLCTAGIHFSLHYPARLIVTVDGIKYIYKTPDEAFR